MQASQEYIALCRVLEGQGRCLGMVAKRTYKDRQEIVALSIRPLGRPSQVITLDPVTNGDYNRTAAIMLNRIEMLKA